MLVPPTAAQTPPSTQGETLPIIPLDLPIIPLDLPISNLDESVTVRSDRVTLKADVLFAFNSARLGHVGVARIAEAAGDLRRLRPSSLAVVGYTDAKGSPSYNLDLSRRRAQAVARRLRSVIGGANALPITTRGHGEGNPVASNTNPDGSDSPRGRARNRRVELIPTR